jgi:hypothetical protein
LSEDAIYILFCDFGRMICGDDANEFYMVINIADVAGRMEEAQARRNILLG